MSLTQFFLQKLFLMTIKSLKGRNWASNKNIGIRNSQNINKLEIVKMENNF